MSIPSPLFNCQQATLLIERRADEVLPLKTRLQLWAHLHLCPYCKRYAFQSPFIARQAKAAAKAEVPAEVVLPPAARRRIQQVLDSHSRP
jgi:hypothetical protein